jgi:hypothetical protein
LYFNFLNALAGAGKTRALARYADRLARRGHKVLFVQPTKRLIDNTVNDELIPLFPNYNYQRLYGDGVVKKIVKHFQNAPVGGQIVFITHAAFMLTPHFHKKADWIVLFDEVPGVLDHCDLKLPQNHSVITSHLTTQNAGATHVELVAKDSKRLRKIVQNKDDDAVWEIFGDLPAQVLSHHWGVWTLQTTHDNLVRGAGTGKKFTTHSMLMPSLFDGFKAVTLAAACFKETLLYKLWASQGVTFKANTTLAKGLRYQTHQNGSLITIHYASEENWSKRLRNKTIDTGSGENTIMNCVRDAVLNLFGADPFLWMANTDVSDDFFATHPHAKRLPNSPHGLNGFQKFHKIVVLSALNLTPAQFTFLREKGIDADEVHAAISRYAAYQAVIRSSARNPSDQTPKDFVVMDRATAEWLSDLFPGATIQRLPGLPAGALKGKPGRKGKHKSKSDKTAAYRARQREELHEQLAQINDMSFAELSYPSLAEIDELVCDENTNRYSHLVTQISHGDLFATKYDPTACMSAAGASTDEFIDVLRGLHERKLLAKEDSGLISPSHFNPDASAETNRGLANVEYVNGIWLDNDGGDLSYEKFTKFFPHLRMVVWNTYSHTPAKPRWRVFIPTSMALSLDAHRLIMPRLMKVLNDNGYWSKKELEKNHRIKNGRLHGFDGSKLNASSMFYLPCQAQNPDDSFFYDFNDESRGPLNVQRWLDDCIAILRDPEPDPDPKTEPETASASNATPTGVAVCAQLIEVSKKLRAGRITKPDQIVKDAIDKWRAAPKGHGNDAFFRLACTLQWAGITGDDLAHKLREEASYAYSPQDRKASISGIVRRLDRHGKIGGRRAA